MLASYTRPIEDSCSFSFEGLLMDRCGPRPDYVVVVDGRVVESDEGRCPEKPDIRGVALCNMVNGHTHCVDYELRVPGGMSLEELVAPLGQP